MPKATHATEPTAESNKARIGGRARSAKELTATISDALTVSGKAYLGGMVELTKILGGFGREIITDASRHVQATLRAKNLRAVGELQAGFAQHQIEVSTARVKEFADLACAKSEEVIVPIVTLFRPGEAA